MAFGFLPSSHFNPVQPAATSFTIYQPVNPHGATLCLENNLQVHQLHKFSGVFLVKPLPGIDESSLNDLKFGTRVLMCQLDPLVIIISLIETSANEFPTLSRL